jgi:hypothetical protein
MATTDRGATGVGTVDTTPSYPTYGVETTPAVGGYMGNAGSDYGTDDMTVDSFEETEIDDTTDTFASDSTTGTTRTGTNG